MAVMEWDPTERADVENVAVLPDRVPVPIVVPPSLNVTVPVGIPPVAATVAVRVTACPKVLGLADDERLVVVEA